MNKMKKLYNKLEKYSKFNEENDVEKFLETADQIILLEDSSSFSVLLKYFDDNSNYNWALESLMIALEHFPYDVHTIKLLENLELLLNKAPLWTVEIFNRIFNDGKSKKTFSENINLASNANLKELFTLIENNCPHHKEFIQELSKEKNFS